MEVLLAQMFLGSDGGLCLKCFSQPILATISIFLYQKYLLKLQKTPHIKEAILLEMVAFTYMTINKDI